MSAADEAVLVVWQASFDDAETLADLAVRCEADLAGGRRGGQALASEAWFGLPSLADGSSGAAWLAGWNGVVVGVAAATLGKPNPLEPAVAQLGMLWVDPEWRELGAGGELIEAVVAWAKSQGAAALDAGALPGDRPLKRLLESSGFKARLITMRTEFELGVDGI